MFAVRVLSRAGVRGSVRAAAVPSAARRWASSPAAAEIVITGAPASDAPFVKAAVPVTEPPKNLPPPPPPKAEPAPKKESGSIWSRFVAFLTGIAVSSVVYYYSVSTDVWESTQEITTTLATLKADLVSSNQDLRVRLAQLEHEVAALKRMQ